MLALNVSKEVLDGFGQMFGKISDANVRVDESNNLLLEKLTSMLRKKVVNGLVTKELQNRLKKSQMHFTMQLKI